MKIIVSFGDIREVYDFKYMSECHQKVSVTFCGQKA